VNAIHTHLLKDITDWLAMDIHNNGKIDSQRITLEFNKDASEMAVVLPLTGEKSKC
jgi:hypothetical protein